LKRWAILGRPSGTDGSDNDAVEQHQGGLGSTHVTTAPRAALGFADRLAVRAEVLLRLAAPEDAGGKFVIFLPLTLIIHFLAAHLAAESLELGAVFGRVHGIKSVELW